MREGWEMKRLKEVCTIRPPKREAKEKLSTNELVSFVPMNILGIEQKYFQPTEDKQLSNVSSSYTYFKNGDILLAKITPCFENGKLGIAKELTNGIGFGSSEYIVYRTNELLINEFLYYFLNQESFREKGKKQMTGAVGHKRIPKDFYEDTLIPIPPLAEQQQIVALLDQAFAAIDKAKANLEQNIANAKELFQSKLNQIFSQTGDGWEEKTFKEVCILQRGNDLPTRLRKEGKFDLVTSSGITDSHFEYKVKGPGVVTGRSGSIGNVFYVENNFWPLNTTLYIKDFKGNVEKYVYYFLKNFDLSKYASGAGVPTLNRNFVHDEIVMSNNDIEKQYLIIKTLDQLTIKTSEVENRYKRKLYELEELKKSILQKAFIGSLTQKEVVV